LPELVKNGAGEIVPYGSDPWELGYPDSTELIKKIGEVFDQYQKYSKNAVKLVAEHFGIEKMVEFYINEIQTLTK
jgi:hypothetical protein